MPEDNTKVPGVRFTDPETGQKRFMPAKIPEGATDEQIHGMIDKYLATEKSNKKYIEDSESKQPQGSDISRFGRGVVRSTVGAVPGMLKTIGSLPLSILPGETGDAARNTLYNNLIAPQIEQFKKAPQESTDEGQAFRYGLGALPIIGPMIGHIADTAGSGDVAGAAGEALGSYGVVKLAPKLEEVPGRVTRGVQRAANTPLDRGTVPAALGSLVGAKAAQSMGLPAYGGMLAGAAVGSKVVPFAKGFMEKPPIQAPESVPPTMPAQPLNQSSAFTPRPSTRAVTVQPPQAQGPNFTQVPPQPAPTMPPAGIAPANIPPTINMSPSPSGYIPQGDFQMGPAVERVGPGSAIPQPPTSTARQGGKFMPTKEVRRQFSEPTETPKQGERTITRPAVRSGIQAPAQREVKVGTPKTEQTEIKPKEATSTKPEEKSKTPVESPKETTRPVRSTKEVIERANAKIKETKKAEDAGSKSEEKPNTPENTETNGKEIDPHFDKLLGQSEPSWEPGKQISYDHLYSLADSLGVQATPLARSLIQAGYDVQPSKFGSGDWGVSRLTKGNLQSLEDMKEKLGPDKLKKLLGK